ncbi:MAG: DUF5658 family protein [Armatimonadota bacterium]
MTAAWQALRRYCTPDFSFRDWTLVLLMALWLYLNVFDLLITYQGLVEGTVYEANRFFSKIIHIPVLAVTLKMSLAYLLIKLVQRVEDRTAFSGLVPLLLANIYLSWVCLHNLHILNGVGAGAHFLRFFPLLGQPG